MLDEPTPGIGFPEPRSPAAVLTSAQAKLRHGTLASSTYRLCGGRRHFLPVLRGGERTHGPHSR
eukprot:scaffold1272_cov250-Pinguiococcus_pyrenoidosus.AAC.44